MAKLKTRLKLKHFTTAINTTTTTTTPSQYNK